ncbi:MAG: stress response serine/threonine protein kinase YihE [Gammaproteobacteria bacterium RBG_16_51_14]|nr:MAG: stress response serine/threonine protein kinase YihE [Gammaproteobacteria bacterium RBG_16_51_14]
MSVHDETSSYQNLRPDDIINAVEHIGYRCDGRILALNSYENRVYQIGLEEAEPVVVKFYRPRRWTDESILEEHRFTLALADYEIPVVAPCADADGTTLFRHGAYRFAVYPRRGGYSPELDNPDHLMQLGRVIGRLHNVGATETFAHRNTMNIGHFGIASYEYLLSSGFIPMELEIAYRTLAEDLIKRIRNCYQRAGDVRMLRIHGDFHHGNILLRNDIAFVVDFDDSCMGPAIQDLWMLLSGDRQYMTTGLYDVLEGYSEFREFDACELNLVEALRTLRIMHYAAWLARRWDDPAFPRAFPFFNTSRYWEEHILALREQAALMDEPPLEWSID